MWTWWDFAHERPAKLAGDSSGRDAHERMDSAYWVAVGGDALVSTLPYAARCVEESEDISGFS